MRKLLLVLVVSCCAKPPDAHPTDPPAAPAPVAEVAPPKPTSAKPENRPAVIGNPSNLRNVEEKFASAVASDVEKTYAGNVFKGDKQYKDKLFTLVLKVKEIRPALGHPAIMSEGSGALARMAGGVRAILADDLIQEEQDMLAELSPGDLVALRCRGAGMALATPHFKDCVPWAVPNLPSVHAARAIYVCLYMRMVDVEVSAEQGGQAAKDEIAEAALVARERMDRDGMAVIDDCDAKERSPKWRNSLFMWACEDSPKAPECVGFATEANREVSSLEGEARKRLAKKSR